uniref:DUF4378 domain-containing protein n=1 Tax=Oryza nivara TaxID=4536 RepID=A0A0E0JAF2_ORYNI
MATLLSPSPASGSSSSSDGGGARRLSELLEEQQEPFSLHLFLLDKGCSPALLDAACWPAAARAMRRRRRRPASALLSVILSKFLPRGAAAAKKVGGKRQQQQQPAAAAAIGDGAGEDDMEDEEEEEEEKQLSPVSVLEQSPFQPPASPAYSKSKQTCTLTSRLLRLRRGGAIAAATWIAQSSLAPRTSSIAEAIVIFRELLAAAYTPALPDHPVNNHTASSPSTSSSSSAAAASRYWEEEEKLEAEIAKVHGLIAAEMAAGWSVCPVGDARRRVGAELAAAVLESLTEEAAAALMLTWSNGRPRCDDDDDDDAIDDDARCVVVAEQSCW